MIYSGNHAGVPSVLHFPGTTKEQMKEFIDKYLTDWDAEELKRQSQSLYYSIITCFSPNLDYDDLLLVKQLDSLGIPYINAWDYCPDNIKAGDWNFTKKLYAYRGCLSSIPDIMYDKKLGGYVMILDARDTYILNLNVKQHIKRYKSALALFNGTKSNYPNKYGKAAIKSDFYVYLNAGCIFGYKHYLSNIIERAIDLAENDEMFKTFADDQLILQEIQQQEENHMQVDEHCYLFQIINDLSVKETLNQNDIIIR